MKEVKSLCLLNAIFWNINISHFITIFKQLHEIIIAYHTHGRRPLILYMAHGMRFCSAQATATINSGSQLIFLSFSFFQTCDMPPYKWGVSNQICFKYYVLLLPNSWEDMFCSSTALIRPRFDNVKMNMIHETNVSLDSNTLSQEFSKTLLHHTISNHEFLSCAKNMILITIMIIC